MKKLLTLFCFLITAAVITPACETLKTVSNTTTGGIFSLNGTWTLTSSTDNNANAGTVVTVYPVVGNASVKTIANNTYCVREGDAFWKNIKSTTTGGFTLSVLVSACSGTAAYKDGTIAVANNDQITVTTRTATNSELIQAWTRVKAQ